MLLSTLLCFCRYGVFCRRAPQEDRNGVEATTVRWKDTVTMGTPDAPRKTADLYAMDGVLWGTVSEEVRDTPEEIYDYFVSVFFLV